MGTLTEEWERGNDGYHKSITDSGHAFLAFWLLPCGSRTSTTSPGVVVTEEWVTEQFARWFVCKGRLRVLRCLVPIFAEDIAKRSPEYLFYRTQPVCKWWKDNDSQTINGFFFSKPHPSSRRHMPIIIPVIDGRFLSSSCSKERFSLDNDRLDWLTDWWVDGERERERGRNAPLNLVRRRGQPPLVTWTKEKKRFFFFGFIKIPFNHFLAIRIASVLLHSSRQASSQWQWPRGQPDTPQPTNWTSVEPCRCLRFGRNRRESKILNALWSIFYLLQCMIYLSEPWTFASSESAVFLSILRVLN